MKTSRIDVTNPSFGLQDDFLPQHQLNNLKGQFGQWLLFDGLTRRNVKILRASCLERSDNHKGVDFVIQDAIGREIEVEAKFFNRSGKYDFSPSQCNELVEERFSSKARKCVFFLGNVPTNWYWVQRRCREKGIRPVGVLISQEKLDTMDELLPVYGRSMSYEDAQVYVDAFRGILSPYLGPICDSCNSHVPNAQSPCPESNADANASESKGIGDPPPRSQQGSFDNPPSGNSVGVGSSDVIEEKLSWWNKKRNPSNPHSWTLGRLVKYARKRREWKKQLEKERATRIRQRNDAFWRSLCR